MTIQELRAKAGSPAGYAGYFLLVFIWFSLENAATTLGDALPGGSLKPLLEWSFRLLIAPAIMAGLYGGIHRRQRDPDASGLGAFFGGIREHYWRTLAANLLYLTVYLIMATVIVIAGGKALETESGTRIIGLLLSAPVSAINLFWLAGLVVERRVFRGLGGGLRTLLFNPYGLLLGIAWGVLNSADSFLFDLPGSITPGVLALDGVRALILAGARVAAIVLALALYKAARGEAPEVSAPEQTAFPGSSMPPAEPVPSTAGNGWVRASFVFAFMAFILLFHFIALALGIIALRVKKRFVFRSAIAICAGVFFTLFYFLLIAGWLSVRAAPVEAPGYAFLARANPALQAQVTLLQQGSYQKVEQQLAQTPAQGAATDWTVPGLSALAKYGARDVSASLVDFQTAAQLQPGAAEFYYYYGAALLDKGKTDQAATQFKAALARAPQMQAAQQALSLIQDAYQPPVFVSTLLSIIVLLILFTLHELGHAYAAWKLGDDTAKNLGRLTLNPIKHLDLVGSILLPGIMLVQQSGIVFGWAKPVPINRANFKDPQRDQMRVSFAGPAVNLLISMVCFIALGCLMLFMRLAWPHMLTLNIVRPFAAMSIIGSPAAPWLIYLILFIKQMFYMSLILGFFNLIPIPPLDGSWILSGLLPEKFSLVFEKTRRFGFLIFLLLVLTPVVDTFLGIPVGLAWGALELLTSSLKLG